MKTRPIIGITGYLNTTNQNIAIRETYTNSIIRAGGLPMILPRTDDDTLIAELLCHLDGLLLSGGGDVDPACYGEEREPECGEADIMRDTCELKLIAQARDKKMPIFGICRGIQVLNVAYGGTLIQDIPKAISVDLQKHRQPEPYTELWHDVRLAQDGLIGRITGLTSMRTNSMHHQAIKTTGGTLMVEAWADDDIIEAVSDREDPSVFGVQFHPEFFAHEHAYAQKLFDYFVKQAAAYRDCKHE